MIDNQTTLRGPVSFEGVGLHCGKPSRLTIEPAPMGHGIVIESNGARIPADADFVTETARGVTLSNDGVSVKTVEHALSALRGLGVDHAVLKMEGEEVPVLDGSAWLYVEAIKNVGLHEYPEMASAWEYPHERSYVFRHKNSSYSVRASTHLCLDVSLSFPNTAIGTQEVGFTFNGNDAYAREVAKSRTFCLEHEIVALKKAGLALGGSLENAIVVDGETVKSARPLHYKDEFARHKLLDLLGDLSLLGTGRLRFSVNAFAPGHEANVALVKQLRTILKKRG